MSISCSCNNEYDPDAHAFCYYHPKKLVPLVTKRSRRCSSCNEPIKAGDLCGVIHRLRQTKNDIEYRIHGEELSLSNKHLCPDCFVATKAIDKAGLCVDLFEDVAEQIEEADEELRADEKHGLLTEDSCAQFTDAMGAVLFALIELHYTPEQEAAA